MQQMRLFHLHIGNNDSETPHRVDSSPPIRNDKTAAWTWKSSSGKHQTGDALKTVDGFWQPYSSREGRVAPPTARLIGPFCAVGRPISHDTATIFKHVVTGSTHTCDPLPPHLLNCCWCEPHPGELPMLALEKPTQHEYWKSFSTCMCVRGVGVFEERFTA